MMKKMYIKKLYTVVSYIITFMMVLSISVSLITYLLKTFLLCFYLKFYDCINLNILILSILFSLFIIIKFYSPSNHHFLGDNNY